MACLSHVVFWMNLGSLVTCGIHSIVIGQSCTWLLWMTYTIYTFFKGKRTLPLYVHKGIKDTLYIIQEMFSTSTGTTYLLGLRQWSQQLEVLAARNRWKELMAMPILRLSMQHMILVSNFFIAHFDELSFSKLCKLSSNQHESVNPAVEAICTKFLLRSSFFVILWSRLCYSLHCSEYSFLW